MCGGRAVGHPQVIGGGQLQKAFRPGAGMVWPLAFITVRQQQYQGGFLLPLGPSGSDKFIQDRLGIIDKIAVLRLPDHQAIQRKNAVTVFKGQRRAFRQRGIMDLKRSFGLRQRLQRDKSDLTIGIMEHSVTLAESTALHILPGQTDSGAVRQDRGQRQPLRPAPIPRQVFQLSSSAFRSRCDRPLQFAVQMEIGRNFQQRLVQLFELFLRNGRPDRLAIFIRSRVQRRDRDESFRFQLFQDTAQFFHFCADQHIRYLCLHLPFSR